MANCKACGDLFSSSNPDEELCPACQRALDRLGGYVAPVVHGKFLERRVRDSRSIICSVCRSDIGVAYYFNYCPNCGAHMDLEDL